MVPNKIMLTHVGIKISFIRSMVEMVNSLFKVVHRFVIFFILTCANELSSCAVSTRVEIIQ